MTKKNDIKPGTLYEWLGFQDPAYNRFVLITGPHSSLAIRVDGTTVSYDYGSNDTPLSSTSNNWERIA